MIQRGMFHRWGALSKRCKQFNVSFWSLEYFWKIYPKNICKGVYLSVWNCCARWAVLVWSMSEHMCCNFFGFSTSAWCRHLVEVYQNCTNATPLAGWCRTNGLGATAKEHPRWKVWPTHPHELSWQDQDEQSWWRSNFWRGDAPLKTLLLGAKKSLTENASWKSCLQSSALKLSYRSANYSPG